MRFEISNSICEEVSTGANVIVTSVGSTFINVVVVNSFYKKVIEKILVMTG